MANHELVLGQNPDLALGQSGDLVIWQNHGLVMSHRHGLGLGHAHEDDLGLSQGHEHGLVLGHPHDNMLVLGHHHHHSHDEDHDRDHDYSSELAPHSKTRRRHPDSRSRISELPILFPSSLIHHIPQPIATPLLFKFGGSPKTEQFLEATIKQSFVKVQRDFKWTELWNQTLIRDKRASGPGETSSTARVAAVGVAGILMKEGEHR
ncbi:hypothetical protein KSP40_PGU003276 [Platanthera guangdongensis]|uniref:Uncharacterized protein n=1 Tax=Platanthera guangdongensis TaxID=2320717 RepID=A0ABR2LKG7_9ASPA